MHRRSFIAAALALPGVLSVAQAQESPYPQRPITLAIGYTAGGLTDSMTRIIAEQLSRELGQSVIVENRAGAAASIAAAYVANAEPDGYTLLLGTTSLAINPSLQPELAPRDPQRELKAIGLAYDTPFALLVRQDLPASSLAEFIEYARANPGKVNVASSGNGAVNHLLLELFNRRAGVRLVHVPYRGATQALVDLRAGRIDATFATPLDAIPVVQEGRGRILAISSSDRLALLPDVPAVAETLEGFHGVFWQGLFAPAGTPEPIVQRLAGALRAVTEDKAMQESVAQRGVTLRTGGPDDLRGQLDEETRMWERLIRDANITIS
jgi:tripartite-type tricarboxylate transporter receptor subunit TctC